MRNTHSHTAHTRTCAHFAQTRHHLNRLVAISMRSNSLSITTHCEHMCASERTTIKKLLRNYWAQSYVLVVSFHLHCICIVRCVLQVSISRDREREIFSLLCFFYCLHKMTKLTLIIATSFIVQVSFKSNYFNC